MQSSDTSVYPVNRLRYDVDQIFDRFLEDVLGQGGSATRSFGGIRLDMTETEDEIRVRAEVPGIEPDALDISLTGDVLTLSGEKKSDAPESNHRTYSERQYGTFSRTIQLPCAVETEDVQAEHKHGVVTITLRKAEAVRPKRIQVKAS